MLKNVAEYNKYKNRDISKFKHEEYQYLNLLTDILNEGHDETGRNGNTRCVYGSAMHFSLENNKTLYRELKVSKGDIQVGGFNLMNMKEKEIPFLRRKLGIVFQDFQLLSDRNIHDNLKFVLQATGWKDKRKISKRIDEVLENVHLENIKNKMTYELSGGEQQRIVIARALLKKDIRIVIMDEPTAALSAEKASHLNNLIISLKKKK